MFFALVFVCTRIPQIITLIPIMGMLAWFVNVFVAYNALTPASILILFITSVLALAWAIFTLFRYHRSSANARFVALVDIAIFGSLIAAVYQLRGISGADCGPGRGPARPVWWAPLVGSPTSLGWPAPEKPCAMLKACWALAIISLFFITAIAAFSHGDQLSAVYYEDSHHYRSSHRSRSSRHSHRRSHSGRSHSGRSHSGRSRSLTPQQP